MTLPTKKEDKDMKRKLLFFAVAAVMMLGVFGLTACAQGGTREKVISLVNKLYGAKELKFVVESNAEHDDDNHISVQKYSNDGKLIYMYNQSTNRVTDEVTKENLYINGKEFDLINMKYQEVNFTQQYAFGSKVPDIGLLRLESTTFEKINSDEYKVTIYPQNLLEDMFGDTVFEYMIKVKNNFILEIRFAGNIISISREIGEQVTIDESQFVKRG